MELVEQGKYNNALYDFYTEKRKEIYLTAEQLAEGLGYKRAKGVNKLIDRNPELKELKYSTLAMLPTPTTGVRREQRLFNKRGVFHICSLSKTEKGKLFRDWVFDYIDRLEKELIKATIAHVKSIPVQNALHDAVKNAPAYREFEGRRLTNQFSNFNRLLNKAVSNGRTDKKENLTAVEIDLLGKVEMYICSLLYRGENYQGIKPLLCDYIKSIHKVALL